MITVVICVVMMLIILGLHGRSSLIRHQLVRKLIVFREWLNFTYMNMMEQHIV